MMRMSTFKKSFRFFIAALLVAAFALTVTACSKEDKKPTYTVTFVTYCDTQIDPQYVEEGKTATQPGAPTRDGYTFVNWYADSACEAVYDFTAAVTADAVIYAKWSKNADPDPEKPDEKDPGKDPVGDKVTLTLDYNYDNKSEQVQINKGSCIPADKQKPERDGFYFGGWFEEAGCVTMINLSDIISKDTTIYAKWSSDPVQPIDGTGIDFSKMPTGVSGGATGTDNFTFDETVGIGSVTVPVTPVQPSGGDGQYTVTFNSNGGEAVAAQSVTAKEKAVCPAAPEKSGYMFCGWYRESGLNTLYDFNEAVTAPLTLYAKWAKVDEMVKSVNGYNEGLAVVFGESNPAGAAVQYAVKGTSNWQSVDAPLIRDNGNGNARVDILGLPAGEYNVKIKPSSGSEITLPEAVAVTAYDRSGYAHFNYSSGVGAYNDDGSLKDGAIVIYVTDANKNTVMKDAVAQYDCLNMFQVPNYGGGKNWNGKDAESIGWWLNNAQYGMNNLGSSSNKRPSNTYVESAGERAKLAFNTANDTHPIVIRFIGTVTVPEGCTAYNSEDEGGSVGDNGNMVRMKNLKNVTIEGVGEDAMIKGWGFHFIAGTDAKNGQGKSFEVRNLTFFEYTEDAVGMEGQATSTTITGPVERCWVHNNVFLPGRCDNPAESDKKEGDGSCDFKRGYYFTLAYNYFEYCHKTNLVGSSDSSLQYNLTMHHNMWYQCGSRIPLLRQANVHFYNNYILGDATETTTPYSHIAKPALSYVHSLRASCLLFSEANYYDGCKNIAQNAGKGALGLAWNNIYTSQTGDQEITELTSRTQVVEAACAYNGTSYTGFYVNESLFYYDKENKASACLLDDAVGARSRVLQCVGVIGFGKTDISMNKYEPASAVQAGTTVDAAGLRSEGEVNGVLFKNFKSGKGKGQIATFRLASTMQVTITGATAKSEECYPQLLDSYGRVWIAKFSGDRTIALPAGTYFIATGLKDKESNLGSISFEDTGASKQERINNAKIALGAIPEEIGYNSYDLINAAKVAYGALLSDEASEISAELVTRLRQAEAAYDELTVRYVIARIDYIGEVTEGSFAKINAAKTAYGKLTAEQQARVTNYSKLTAAETAFAQFAAKNVTDLINDLPDLTKAEITTEETLAKVEGWLDTVNKAYDELTEDQQAKVTGYGKIAAGYAELDKFANMIEFRAQLAEADVAAVTVGQGAVLKRLYEALTETQKATLLVAENAKYAEIMVKYEELASKTKLMSFNNKVFTSEDGDFWEWTGKFKDGTSATINGETYTNGLKLDSAGSVKFTTSATMTLKVYYANKARIKLDGTTDVSGEAEGDHFVATVVIEAGEHTLTKGKDGESYLYIVELSPVN